VLARGPLALRRPIVATRTPFDLRADLERLLELAVDVGVAESKLEKAAKQIRAEAIWLGDLPHKAAVDGAIVNALGEATGEIDGTTSGFDVAQAIQDALDVVDLALARDEVRA
jgi:hypothetical protein